MLTHRRLRPGSYDAFREAWRPEGWWPGFEHGYHLRSADDPDEVISFAFYNATMEGFEAMRDDPEWLASEERRLRRLAPLELSMRIGGVYEVTEAIAP